ncbi:hypothetical protein [Streptomyces sp. NPDC003688]
MADHRDCVGALHTLVQRHAAKSGHPRRVQASIMLPLTKSSSWWGDECDREALLALLGALEDHQKALDDLRLLYASRVMVKGANLADLGRVWNMSRQGARHRWNVLKRRLRPGVTPPRDPARSLNGLQ